MSTEFFNDQWRIPSNENQNKISNYSMEFDGTNDSVNVGLIKPFDNDVSNFAISYWIKADFSDLSKPFNGALIHLDFRYNGATRGLAIESSATSLIFYTAGGLGYNTTWTTPTSGLNNNEWNHIVLNFDGSIVADADKAEFWINGSKKTSTVTNPGNNYIKAITGDGFLGNGFNSYPLEGQLDQFCTFDYTLSQDQIIQLGAEGYAFNFIPNDYIDLGTTTSYDTGDLSAAIWVKITNNGTTQYVFSNSGSPSIKGFDIKVRGSNEIGIQRYNPTNGADSGWISPGFVYDVWQHLAFTYEESTGTIKTFLNGNLVATNTGTSTATLPSVKLTIGSYKGVQSYANGELSNAAIFSSKLEDSEIATLYNNGKPGNISSLNPTAWYKLDDSEIFNSTSTEWSVDNNALPSTYKSSLDFSGDYVNVSSLTDTTYNNLSFSSWVYWEGGQYSSVFSFAENGGSDTLSGFVVEVRTGGEIRVGCDGVDGSGWGIIVSSAITANTWVHIAVTLSSSGGLILYKNGVSIGTNTTQNLTPVYRLAAIGVRAYSGSIPLAGHAFNGRLSNIALWNTTLTGSQITTLYNNGTPEASISHSPLSWWKLNNTTTGIQDSGSASNNGTNVGATEYAGFVNSLAGDSVGMDASNLVASDINGELIANPMITSPKPIAYYQLGDQSVSTGPTSDYLVPNNSLSDYVFNFNGTDDYIDTNSTFNTLTSFTVSAWFKADNTAATAQGIVSTRVNGITTSKGFDIYISANVLTGRVYNNGATEVVQSFTDTTSWHNVVITYNGTTLELFLDNLSIGTATGNYDNSGGRNLTIGKWGPVSGGSYYFDGLISNVSIFNTALSTANIETIYNNGAPGDISSLNPTAWYKLNASEIFNTTSTEWSIDNNAYPSVYNSSLDFDGASDFIDLGQDVLFNSTQGFSVSAWVNLDSYSPLYPGIIRLVTDQTQNFIIGLSNVANYTGVFFGSSTQFIKLRTTGDISGDFIGTWKHVCITFDGVDRTALSSYKIYIDGSLVGLTTAGNFANPTGNINTIGNGGFSNRMFNGLISNTAIWNTELTSTQVGTLYNNGTPEASISHSPVSWWKLDNTTTGLIDNGSASNNGTNVGTTEYVGFVNALAGESVGMDSSNLVVSDLQQTSGYSPYALDFDGINDYLDFNNASSNIMTNKNSISISGWFKLNSNTSSTLAGNWYSASDAQYILRYSTTAGHGIQWYITSNSNTNRIDTGYVPNVGEWIHVVGVKDPVTNGGQTRLYINGILEGTKNNTDFSVAIANNNGSDQIGVFSNNLSFMNGSISNVAYWTDTALTQAQVTEIYNQGVPSNLNTFSGAAPTHWIQLGSNSSFNTNWTCLDEIGTNNAVSAGGMTNDDIVNGVGYSANGLGTSSIDIKGDAPYSTANGLSENMDVLDRTLDTPIRNTHSIQLDGTDEHVILSTSPSALIGAMNPYSVSAWVYVAQSDLSSSNYFIMGAQDGIDRWYFRIQVGYARFAYGTLLDNTTLTPITGDQWNHVVFTYNGVDNFNTYINGVNKSTVTNSATQGVPSFNAFIGALNAGSGAINEFKGKMDEVSIFSSELSGTQVTSIYNNGVPNNILPLNPALWYRFESLTTNAGVVTVADDSGNGLTGTVENGAALSTNVP